MNTSNFARLKELFRPCRGRAGTDHRLSGRFHHAGQPFHPARQRLRFPGVPVVRGYLSAVEVPLRQRWHRRHQFPLWRCRAVTDVLMYQPDFVVVDFSVNDLEVPFRQETYEGVVRKLLAWPSHPAVVLLNNIYYDTGETAQDEHNAVGDHYGVPHVSIRDSIYKDLRAGKYASRTLLSPDGLHPNDYGHGLVAGEIIKLLEAVNAHREEPEQEPAFPAPLTANAYENAQRLTSGKFPPS